jgi:hypothetical protein
MNVTIEIERNNVTVAEFLAYVKRQCAPKGTSIDIERDSISNLRQNIYRSYHVKDGIKHCSVMHKCKDEKTGFMLPDDWRETEYDGSDAPAAAETSREFPYDWQTYILGFDGAMYNEICEFTFNDERRGHGYFFLANKDAPGEAQAIETKKGA